MTGYIYDKNGKETLLPPLLSWDISLGSGEPCDSFEVCCAYEAKYLKSLSQACRFRAAHGGKTVFSGRIDEYEVCISDDGGTVSVCGRSLAALLLDNEAEASEYLNLSPELLSERHIKPYGISVSIGTGLKTLSGFAVTQGESEWSVVKRFCSLCGCPEPRFSQDGTLLLGVHGGAAVTINDQSPMAEIRHRDCRYGMISAVLVKNRSTGAKYGVSNQPFIDRGGSSRRIITVPRKTGAEAMRYTAAYQIKQSAKGKFTVSLVLPSQFPARPGDTVRFDSRRLGLKGSFTVTRLRSFAGGSEAGSELTMEVRT